MGHHLGIEVTIDVTKKMVHKDAEVSPQNKMIEYLIQTFYIKFELITDDSLDIIHMGVGNYG
jgi:uncharacterized membrane protein